MDIPDEAPVMTLPNVTLFPQAMMRLHIFEPRYRQMLEEVLHGRRMFIIAMRKPGSKREVPFTVAGLGLVRVCIQQPDGTSSLILEGLSRVELIRTVRRAPFRVSRIRALPTPSRDSVTIDALMAKVRDLVTERIEQELPALEKGESQESTGQENRRLPGNHHRCRPRGRSDLLVALARGGRAANHPGNHRDRGAAQALDSFFDGGNPPTAKRENKMSNPTSPTESGAGQDQAMSALFANMIMQNTNMALIFLGQALNPQTGQTEQGLLEHARYFIDLLEMIAVKTKGNLDKQEDALLKQSLTHFSASPLSKPSHIPRNPHSPPATPATPPTSAPAGPPVDEQETPIDRFSRFCPARENGPQAESHKKFSRNGN